MKTFIWNDLNVIEGNFYLYKSTISLLLSFCLKFNLCQTSQDINTLGGITCNSNLGLVLKPNI